MCLVWHIQIQGFLLYGGLWDLWSGPSGRRWPLKEKAPVVASSLRPPGKWLWLLFSAHAPLLTMLQKDSSAFCDKDLLVHLSKLENNLIPSSSQGKYFPFWRSRKYLFITVRQLQHRLLRYLFLMYLVFLSADAFQLHWFTRCAKSVAFLRKLKQTSCCPAASCWYFFCWVLATNSAGRVKWAYWTCPHLGSEKSYLLVETDLCVLPKGAGETTESCRVSGLDWGGVWLCPGWFQQRVSP